MAVESPPPLNREAIRELLDAFDLRTLFIDLLGWDHGGLDITVPVADKTFLLEAVAQKRGFVAYQCVAGGRTVLDRATRQKIERQVAKAVYEHLIVFAPKDYSSLCWQWVKRELGQPPRYRQHIYSKGQSAEDLAQRLEYLRFTLEEEERISIADATSGAAKAFDVEKVTKRFYERFREEHRTFLGFIKGIRDVASREWYASLMLNRMMFIYFIQKRRFLDDDPDYLRNRLATVAKTKGNGRFHSFYRLFLLRLFHDGLGQPEAERHADLTALLGRVPYLNGGLFDVHDLERDNPSIDIPDQAFERLFDFFDAYQWHLDDRPLRDDNEINPDVLGYIFEKYVNQKQMGAYYTKEDITGYISRNTIVPRLFDQAERDCAIAFKPGGSVWRLLAEDPDRYLYPALRHGIASDMSGETELDKHALPKEIDAGLKDVAKRAEWNNAAPPEYALPTETWREHIARRQRYQEVRGKLAAGEVSSINDLITYNLDIERFAQDAISTSEGPELVRAFWKAIRNVAILDPTVGSGAFLFAALNVLEPLYNACLDAMRGIVEDLKHSRRKHRPERLSDFRKVISQLEEHPSERYFVLKSIVIDNLYGVDIMEEAVEICKLRLFLKLVAQLKRCDQIEPLPDIDFNVRPGNTLVGFTSMDEVEETLGGDCIARGQLPAIQESAEIADRAFRQFRSMQTERHLDAALYSSAKADLRHRHDELRQKLDAYLAEDYGVRLRQKGAYRKWQRSHQPFHWFVEFYGIIERGGFDVIIGNPPYVESRTVKQYSVRGYETAACGNLYTLVVERNAHLVATGGRTGMIVPHSAICTDRMGVFAQLLAGGRHLWTSTYDIRPAKLFDGADQRLLIYLSTGGYYCNASSETAIFSSRYNRWHGDMRALLMQQIQFTSAKNVLENSISKIGDDIELEILDKLHPYQLLKHGLCEHGDSVVYYHNAPRYWIRAMDFTPFFWNERDGEKVSSQVKTVLLRRKTDLGVVVAALNSSLFYWWFLIWSDCRHLNRREIDLFPLGLDVVSANTRCRLRSLSKQLMANFRQHSQRRETNYATTGKVIYDEFYQKASKPIVDKIDRALAPHFGLTEEHVDFIINYGIKFRMGVGG